MKTKETSKPTITQKREQAKKREMEELSQIRHRLREEYQNKVREIEDNVYME